MIKEQITGEISVGFSDLVRNLSKLIETMKTTKIDCGNEAFYAETKIRTFNNFCVKTLKEIKEGEEEYEKIYSEGKN